MSTPTNQPAPKPYELTPHERAAVHRFLDRKGRTPPAPKFKVTHSDGAVSIKPDHPDVLVTYTLLADVLGTRNILFAEDILHQLANVSQTGKELTARELNCMVATVHAIGPRDPTEALLAVQMATVHMATTVAARRLNRVERIDQQDSASNMLNKLTRTFCAQIEALKKYRSNGEQSVRVTHQHVNVNAAQAVIGINQGGRGAHEKSSQPHVPSGAHEQSPPMLGHEQAVPIPMPGAGSDRLVRVSVPRCAERSAEGKSQPGVAPRDGDQ